MFLTITLLTCAICLVITYVLTLKSRYDYFRHRNINGPAPLFFFGHLHTIWSSKYYSRLLQSWTQQFGSICGIFEGSRPVYVVSDVDFLHEVFFEKFSSFHSHRTSFLLRMTKARSMITADPEAWRRQRHAISPAFSAVKLKAMTPLIHQCIDSLMRKLSTMSQQETNEFNIYLLYKRLTMDVICHCAFGIDTDMQNDINNELMLKAAACFEQHVEYSLWTKLSFLMPWLTPCLTKILFGQLILMKFLHRIAPSVFPDVLELAPTMWLQSKVDSIIDTRTVKRNDLLQLLLDAAATKSINEDEVKLNTFLFMAAGFETTSTALAYCTYILATKPDIQQKLQAEIDEHQGEEIDYDLVSKMTYMDLFIREVLRMFPISAIANNRFCNETTTVCGHQIDKGSAIQPDIFSIHYNYDLWGPEDPNEFIPERHTRERHPVASLAFGVGSRVCIGMRFALTEMKMCLTRLLRNYTVLSGEHLESGFTMKEGFVIQPDAVNVKLEERH